MVKMVGRLGGAVLLLAATCLLLPRPASAIDPVGKFSISGRVGIGGTSMKAINDGISRSNNLLASLATSQEWEVPDKIHTAFEFTGDASYELTPWIRLGISYGSLTGSTGVDYVQRIEVKPSTKMIVPKVMYRLPVRLLDNLALRVYGGAVILTGAKCVIDHEDTSPNSPRLESITINGSGTGLTGGLTGEMTLSERFVLAFEGGYRAAKASFDSGKYTITKLRDPGGNTTEDPPDVLLNDRDPSQTSYLWGFMDGWNENGYQEQEPQVYHSNDLDFSGAYLQVGLRIYIF